MKKTHNLPDRKTLRQKLRHQESLGIRVLLFENRELLEIPDDVAGVIPSAVLEQPPRLRQ